MELDSQIREKRTEIREALAAHQKARETAAQMRNLLSELRIAAGAEGAGSDPESLRLAEAQAKELKSAEQKAAMRFSAISDEGQHAFIDRNTAFGHITWTGPLQHPNQGLPRAKFDHRG